MVSVRWPFVIRGFGRSRCGKPAGTTALGSDAAGRRRPQTLLMSVVVVATDGSPGAEVAVEQAVELASATGDSLAVVTVWQALQGDFGLAHPPSAILSELLSAEREHAEAHAAIGGAQGADRGADRRCEVDDGRPSRADLCVRYRGAGTAHRRWQPWLRGHDAAAHGERVLGRHPAGRPTGARVPQAAGARLTAVYASSRSPLAMA